MAFSKLLVSLLVWAQLVASAKVSTFAGATRTFLWPPESVTATVPDPNFPDATHVGFAGPTPTGDEAAAMATAPVLAPNSNRFPLVRPIAADAIHQDEFDVIRYFGNFFPWRSLPSANFGLPGASPIVPKECEIVQAHLIHRHGARYPTREAGTDVFATKLHGMARTHHGLEVDGPLEFLKTWKYKLGGEILTPFGRSELFDLGVGFRVRYGSLLKEAKDLPVFRTTSQARMVDSALNFAAGFFGLPDYNKKYHQLIEVEEDKQNITLASYKSCPNFKSIGTVVLTRYFNKWVKRYLKSAHKRLSKHISPRFKLTTMDCYYMQNLCALETVALGYSEFCGLFTQEEWKGYSYATCGFFLLVIFLDRFREMIAALQMWYGVGPGSPIGAAMGIGWVQELVSRLTKARITEFKTSVNKTIVQNETRSNVEPPIYVDAAHDITIASIFTAMNFTNFIRSGTLPSKEMPLKLSYKMDEVMPFATNLVGQVLSCPARGEHHCSGSREPTHIRWILNDGVLPLTGINGCNHDKNGMCEFGAFIDGMKQRMEEVDYDFACRGDYEYPNPNHIVDGRLPRRKVPRLRVMSEFY
ncbi:3-phytase A [Leucoagaricus sp. SymC.cos]|nr:3-phytase A [Leucoagaricus sp. SymC.cos]